MKKILYILPVLFLGFTACQNFFDEKQLGNEGYAPSDIRTGMTYELTDDDYKQIASNESNIAKAFALDPDSAGAYAELQAIGKNLYFTESATADMYAPALMASKFPYLDNGTMCEVSYRYLEGKSPNTQAFASTTPYTLNTKDYESIWNKRGAEYLTPATLESIPAFLTEKYPTAPTGKMVVLYHNYRETEPNAEDLSDFLPYALTLAEFMVMPDVEEHEITGIIGEIKVPISGRFYIVDGNDSVFVAGLKNAEGKTMSVGRKAEDPQTGDTIVIRTKYSTEQAEPLFVNSVYVRHTAPAPASEPEVNLARRRAASNVTASYSFYQLNASGEWMPYTNSDVRVLEVLPQSVYTALGVATISDVNTIKTYLQTTYPYAQTDEIYVIVYNSTTGTIADEWIYDGTDFVMTSECVTETMSFEVKNNTWIANISTYLQQPFVGDGLGKFTIQHVNLDGLSYIWRYQALYGATASSYVSGTNHAVEDWLISPAVRMKKAIQPQMSFMQAVRYGSEANNPKWLKVMVTDNFTGDVTTTEWKHLEFPAPLPDGSSWVFQTSGFFDLSEYAGQTIWVAFLYNTFFEGDPTSCPTWEIQNLLIAEPAEEE